MVAMILPFSTMNFADAAPNENANDKAKDKHASISKINIHLDSEVISDIAKSNGQGHEKNPLFKDEAELFKELIPIQDAEFLKYADLIKNNPMPTDDKKNIKAQNLVAKDHRIQNLLGDSFRHSSTGYSFDGVKWEPILNFQTDEGYTVTVTIEDDKVKKIKKTKSIKFTDQFAGFGVRGINIPYPMSANLMSLDAPDYNHNGDVVGQPNWVVLLLNSMKAGSTLGQLCDSANMPDDYWAQIGLKFDADGVTLGYTDTGFNCDAQELAMPINAGDRIHFFTDIEDATNTWTLYAVNLDIPPGEPNTFGFYRVLADSDLMDTTSIFGTNVFFENQNSASTAWSLGFADDVLVDYAGFKYPPNGNWYYWLGDKFADAGCHPGPIVEDVDLLVGSFASATHDVTWDVSEMDTLCGQN